jgi:hypothetical protein
MNTDPSFALEGMLKAYFPPETVFIYDKFTNFCVNFASGFFPWVCHKDTEEFISFWLEKTFPEIARELTDDELRNILKQRLNEARLERLSAGHGGSDGPTWELPQSARRKL